MNKFENVDVFATLNAIMRQNTAHYQNDFEIDKRMLWRAAESSDAAEKNYLWMSRPSGTHCLRERDVYLQGAREHNTFRFYAEQTHDRVLAYAVMLTGIEQNKVMGNLYELDYREQVKQVQRDALPADTITLFYENGIRSQHAKQYFDGQPDRDFGNFLRFEVQPNDPDALQALLLTEHQRRERLLPGDIKVHIGQLASDKVLVEAKRIAESFQKFQAPNSPNKTHFMVELSPGFQLLASGKDHDRLFALLPYKTLHLSTLKGQRGVFALIGKDENRNLPLRKPRASIRSQLKEAQQKATPQRTDRNKNNDLEV